MKNLFLVAAICLMTSMGVTPAQGQELSQAQKASMKKVFDLLKQQQYEEGAVRLFHLAYNPAFRQYQMQLKYMLGVTMMELKLDQVAAFHFVDVIRDANSKYVGNSLEKLTIVADRLNDDTLLNYALSRVNLQNLPAANRDLVYYRVGEFHYQKGMPDKAAFYLSKVPRGSAFYSKAKYLEGVCYAEQNKVDESIQAFQDLYRTRARTGITDPNRVAAIAGLARAYYQKKDWDQAIQWFRRVPRDTEMWHDSLFELSWAYMRSARFRSVLSNFHSLHSAYYEDHFFPESILLRSIVYLYICQYDEMEKTLGLFDKLYQPVFKSMTRFAVTQTNPLAYSQEFAKMEADKRARRRPPPDVSGNRLPYAVVRAISKEGDVKRTRNYIDALTAETKQLDELSDGFKRSTAGRFASKILGARIKTAQTRLGRQSRVHLISMAKNLRDLFEQHGFARYEMLNGRKELLRKKIASKGLVKKSVDEDMDRSFYIQNGFEYWPFRGEYWLDEIGNYFYLGTQRCE